MTPDKKSKLNSMDNFSLEASTTLEGSTLEKSVPPFFDSNQSANLSEDEDMQSAESKHQKVSAFSPSSNILNFESENRDFALFDSSLTAIMFGNQ